MLSARQSALPLLSDGPMATAERLLIHSGGF